MADLIDRAVTRKAVRDVMAAMEWPPTDGDAQIDAVLDAISALPAQGVRVKPLVFSEFSEGGCMGRPYPFQYFITQGHNGRFLCHHDDTWHDTLPAAQANAQADYQRAALATAEAGGVEAQERAKALTELALADAPLIDLEPHVNETPKSEHDAQDALPPAPVDALVKALNQMVIHAEWREQNEGVFWDATKEARAALAAYRGEKP